MHRFYADRIQCPLSAEPKSAYLCPMHILVQNPKILVLEHQPYASQLIAGGGALAGACLMYFSPNARYGGFWMGLLLLLGSGIFYLRSAYVVQWVFDREAGLLRMIRKRRYFGIQETTFPLPAVLGVEVTEFLPKTRVQSPEEESRSPRYKLTLLMNDGQKLPMHERKLPATEGLSAVSNTVNAFLKQ